MEVLKDMMKTEFVPIHSTESKDVVYLPLDYDNTLSVELVNSQFPFATCLKYCDKKNDVVRRIRKCDGKYFLSHNYKWKDLEVFWSCSRHKMRIMFKMEKTGLRLKQKETVRSIHAKFPSTFDLLAIGLSYDTTEEDLYTYFSRFGALLYCRVKLDEITFESKGTAYFRFRETLDQSKCLRANHFINKTRIIIKIPKAKVVMKDDHVHKIYLYNITPTITREDIRAYFSQFGMVLNVFKPYDNRNFAFVTFTEKSTIDRVLEAGHVHIFNGGRVNVNRVVKKDEIEGSVGNFNFKPFTIKRLSDEPKVQPLKKKPRLSTQEDIPHSSIDINPVVPNQNMCSQSTTKGNQDVIEINTETTPDHIVPSREFSGCVSYPNKVISQVPFCGERPVFLADCQPSTSYVSSLPSHSTDLYRYPQTNTMKSIHTNDNGHHRMMPMQQPPQMNTVEHFIHTTEQQRQISTLVHMFIDQVRNNLDNLCKFG